MNNITQYNSGITQALNGQRLAIITYKSSKDKAGNVIAAAENKAVSLPVIGDMTVSNRINRLMPYVIGMLNGVQDKIVRELIASGSTVVSDIDINVDACIAYLEAESIGGRLTKQVIGDWFDAELLENLTVAIANKLGVSDTPTFAETSKIDALVAGYKDKLSALAGGKTNYEKDMAETLGKALKLVRSNEGEDGNGNDIASKLKARLSKMDKKETELFKLF